jgi:hypothetical protein
MSSLQQKWRKGQNRFCPGRGYGREREELGALGEKWPNVCTYE